MSSTSFNQSSSSSSPVVTETPENALLDQISGVASGLAQQMNSWAQQTYAQTSAVTNEAVNNFFNASQQMMGLAGNMTSQYNNLFAPENADLVRDADSYASTDRQQVDMGQAGATQAQAGDQAVKNSEANLVSMGIDPSSGRYAALDKAAAVQNAANVAGAENMQRNQDIQTGQNLRSQAVQVGSELPAAISNATNTAIQANTGASNASLANANTGVNLNSLADKYLQTAMGVKLPLQGQQSNSQSTGNSNSNKPENGSGSGAGGSGAGGSGAGPGGGPSSWSGMTPNTDAQGGTDGGRATGGAGSRIQNVPPYGQDDNAGGTDWGTGVASDPNGYGGTDFSQWGGDNIYQPDQFGSSASLGDQQYDPISNTDGSNMFGDTSGDFSGATFGNDPVGTFTGSQGAQDTQFGNINYDPSANQSTADWSLPPDDSGGSSAFDSGTSAIDYSGAGGFDGGGGGDDSDGGGGFAGGGSVGQPTTGGPVPPSASPTGGARTDDVRANLNSGEFVVPKDVTRWKGEEFMHKLIADSRQKRMKMQAMLGTGGKPMPPGDPRAQQRPTFNSRPMGAR
jgi:hypothetical protein